MVRSTLPATPTRNSALVLVLVAGVVLPVLTGCANARAYSRTPPVSPSAAAPEPAAAAPVEARAGGAFDNSLVKLQQRAQAAEAERLRKEWEPENLPDPQPPRQPRRPRRLREPETRLAPQGPRRSPEEYARLQEKQFQTQLAHQQSEEEERRAAEADQVRAAAEENAKEEKDRVYFPWKGGWAYTTADARRGVTHSSGRKAPAVRPEPAKKNPGE